MKDQLTSVKGQLKKLNGSQMKKSFDQWLISFKGWMKKATDITIQESKVLAIRAKEAGKLTSLSAKKHKLNREYQDICAQLGQSVIKLSETHQEIIVEPKVQELIDKAAHLQNEIKHAKEEIELLKKESEDEISSIHKKAA